MKPTNFSDLPIDLQESLLWDMELDYCSYESSKESAIHDYMNGNVSRTNQLIITNYYKALDETSLIGRAINVEKDVTARSHSLRSFLCLDVDS